MDELPSLRWLSSPSVFSKGKSTHFLKSSSRSTPSEKSALTILAKNLSSSKNPTTLGLKLLLSSVFLLLFLYTSSKFPYEVFIFLQCLSWVFVKVCVYPKVCTKKNIYDVNQRMIQKFWEKKKGSVVRWIHRKRT